MRKVTARQILLLNMVLSLIVSFVIGIRSDTPDWSPVNWALFFLAFCVFVGGPIALYLEWRATAGWTRPNPYAEERLQVDEPLVRH